MKDLILEEIKNSGEKGIKKEILKERIKCETFDELLEEMQLEGTIFEKENGKFIEFPYSYQIGTIMCDHKGNRFVTNKDGRMYVNFDDLNGALDFDIVVFKPNLLSKRAVDQKVLKRKINTIVCEVHQKGHRKSLKSYNTPGLLTISIDEKELENYVDGDRLVVEIEKDSFLGVVKGKIITHLGHKNSPDIEEKCIANARGFNTEWSDAYLEELEKLPTEVTKEDMRGRLDYRNKEVFTIDGEDTKDIDDAISLETLPNGNKLLGVHIADVAHYIKPGTEMFNETIRRATSLYLGDSVIPMIHPKVSNGICSLNEGVDRLARSTFMEINPKGEIVNYQKEYTVINSKKKMTYEEVTDILDEGLIADGYEKFVNTIMMMSGLTDTLIDRREDLGGMQFSSNEIKVVTDSHNKTLGFKKHEQGTSDRMIENFMIASNETVAKAAYDRGLPYIYRVHEVADEEKIEKTITLLKDLGYRFDFLKDLDKGFILQSVLKELSKKEEFSVLSTLFLKSMKKAEYSPTNIGHYALASDYYTHSTAPIRRVTDFINQILEDYYTYEPEKINWKFIDKDLAMICEHASFKERQADLAEEELNRLRMCEYMEEHIGETFTGRIVEIYPDEINIITDDNIYGSVPVWYIEEAGLRYRGANKSMSGGKNIYLLGNKVEVKVSGVSLELKKVFFDLGDNLSLKHSSKAKKLNKTNKRN